MPPDWLSEFVATQRPRAGAVKDHVSSFAAVLAERGYAKVTTKEYIWLVADFGRWLDQKAVSVADLDDRRVGEYLTHRRRRGFASRSHGTALQLLLSSLRDAGVAPAIGTATVERDTPAVEIESAFTRYLVEERGLHASTRVSYVRVVRRFLSSHFHRPSADLGELRADDVGKFVVREARTRPKCIPVIVPALRVFLRWIHQRGDTERNLAGCVPPVATWHLSTVPKSLPGDQVERLLQRCDRSTSIGRRDYAILLLLARLGLRAAEVVAMELGDLDWERGELVVRGKGGREDRLPLPLKVGGAVATYLRRGRPQCSTRRLFVRAKAPHRGFCSSVAISNIVERGLDRAGLEPPRKGAHTLRHALACNMLRRGASLAEIGQILRHRSPDTTAIYAKVDIAALRTLALPWPRTGGDA